MMREGHISEETPVELTDDSTGIDNPLPDLEKR